MADYVILFIFIYCFAVGLLFIILTINDLTRGDFIMLILSESIESICEAVEKMKMSTEKVLHVCLSGIYEIDQVQSTRFLHFVIYKTNGVPSIFCQESNSSLLAKVNVVELVSVCDEDWRNKVGEMITDFHSRMLPSQDENSFIDDPFLETVCRDTHEANVWCEGVEGGKYQLTVSSNKMVGIKIYTF